MSIYLIRHGETAGNAERIMQFPDTPLNDRGLRQAEQLANRLRDVGISRLLVSDYVRTQMTAASIAQQTAAPIELNDLLRERNFGELCGRSLDEVGDVFRPGLEPLGGENWQQFHTRIDKAWQRIIEVAEQTDGHTAVVSHGMVCYSLALRWLSLPVDIDVATLRFGNTSVTIIETVKPWVVELLNCCHHLDHDSAHSVAATGI